MAAVAALVVLVIGMVQNVSATNARQDRQTQDRAIYDTKLQTFRDAAAARELCLDSVRNSLKNRAMWERTVKLLDDAGLSAASTYLEAGPLLAGPPRSNDECGPPPTAPELPESLR